MPTFYDLVMKYKAKNKKGKLESKPKKTFYDLVIQFQKKEKKSVSKGKARRRRVRIKEIPSFLLIDGPRGLFKLIRKDIEDKGYSWLSRTTVRRYIESRSMYYRFIKFIQRNYHFESSSRSIIIIPKKPKRRQKDRRPSRN